MNAVANELVELKLSLENLETAVQQPRDERHSVQQVVDCFPAAFQNFNDVIRTLIRAHGMTAGHARELFSKALQNGWLHGDLSLWLHLVGDFEQMTLREMDDAQARSIAQDVRACSGILWETYETLLSRFRSQTQIHPMPRPQQDSHGAQSYA